MRYLKKRHYDWSTSIAYIVGLMASDGCLQSDGRHLDITSVDTDQLENFNQGIGRIMRISEKSNSSAVTAYRIQFSDVAFYDFLLQVGLTPNKSKTLGKLNIPTEYYAPFLRGLFDGDGSCYGYYDPRWPTSFVYYVSFSSASPAFLDFISTANRQIIGVKGNSIRNRAHSMSLVYGKADSYLLYKSIYKHSEGLFLNRKRSKWEGFINIDGNAIIPD
ncbi:MAG: LAGLIDADG family homing endonuclease [Patescibacteria group bacterium]